jgi:hypothetical protein
VASQPVVEEVFDDDDVGHVELVSPLLKVRLDDRLAAALETI